LLKTLDQAAGHLHWEVDCPPSQTVGSNLNGGFLPAKLPSFGRYSLDLKRYTYQT